MAPVVSFWGGGARCTRKAGFEPRWWPGKADPRAPLLCSGCTCDNPQRFSDEGRGGGAARVGTQKRLPALSLPPPYWPLAGGDERSGHRWGLQPSWRSLSAPSVSHRPFATGSSTRRRTLADHVCSDRNPRGEQPLVAGVVVRALVSLHLTRPRPRGRREQTGSHQWEGARDSSGGRGLLPKLPPPAGPALGERVVAPLRGEYRVSVSLCRQPRDSGGGGL